MAERGNIIDSFFVALGFDIDSSELDEFKEKAAGARTAVLALGAVMVAAAGAIAGWAVEQAKAIDELGDWSEANNIAIEKIQALGHAAQIEGSSLEQMKQTVYGLNRAMGESIAGTGRGVIAFKTWGLSAKDASGKVKSFDQMLGEIADKMKGMSHQEALSMAEKFGIDVSLLPLLTKGKDRLKDLTDEALRFGVVTQEQATVAGDLTDALDRWKFVVLGLTRTIAVEFMPPITEALIGMRKWAVLNKDWIKSSIAVPLKLIVTIAGLFLTAVFKIVNWVFKLVEVFLRFKPVLWAVTTALYLFASALIVQGIAGLILSVIGLTTRLYALATAFTFAGIAAAFIPLLIAGIIVAIGLLVDDLIEWKNGNDSVIGDLIKQFPYAVDIAVAAIGLLSGALVALTWRTVTSMATMAASAAQAAIVWVADMVWMASTTWGTLIPAMWAAMATGLTTFGSIAVAVLAATWPILAIIAAVAVLGVAAYLLWDNWSAVLGWLTDKFKGFMTYVDKVVAAAKSIGSFFGMGGDVQINATRSSQQAAPVMGGAAPGGIIGRAANGNAPTQHNDNSQHTSIAKIEIVSPDPEKAGAAVSREIDRRNRQVIRNGQTGVAL